MGHDPAFRRGSERGFSLIELMIYLAVLAIIGIPMVMVTLSISRASAEGDMISKIQERNRSAIQRILTEYEESLKGTTVVSADGTALQFTSNGGFDGVAATPGPVIRYEIRISAGESANGVDDNGNGLGDEGTMVRMDQSLGQEVVLTDSVKTTGSSFARNGDGITVTITTFGRTHGAKEETAIRRAITIFPRN